MHLAKIASLLMVLSVTSSVVYGEKCVPGVNCRAPDCRCWDDPQIPGTMKADDVPQMILLSFSYAVNQGNVDNYLKVIDGLRNPNGCPSKSTFFVQGQGTSFDVIANLYDKGHEIAVTTDDGQIPTSYGDWMYNFRMVLQRLRKAGIPDDKVQGVRAPTLSFGGDHELKAMRSFRLDYDSTCVTRNFTSSQQLLWPYTMDFTDGSPACNVGQKAQLSHPGLWEFSFPVLDFDGRICSAPSACADKFKNEYDVFDFFFFNFMKHYEGNRAPFNMYIDPTWLLSQDYHLTGTREFLQFLRFRLPDAWFVSYQQALQWIKDPVPISQTGSYRPWSCSMWQRLNTVSVAGGF